MLKSTVLNLTNQGTQRSNASSLQSKKDKFILINCPDFKFKITFFIDVFADDLITFFTLYYTFKIIESIV
jgi:hypothetical protein